MKSLSCVRLFGTTWTVACQAPPSMRFSRQEYWNGLPFPSSRGFSQPRDWSRVSGIASGLFVAQLVKSLLAMQETQIWSLGWEDPLEKEMAIHSVFLLGKSHGQRSLVSYSSWGCKESDMTGHTHTIWLFWFHNKGSYCLVLLCMFLPRLKLIHLISLNVCNFLWFCQMMFLSMQLFLILWI